ncbi:zinc finger CCCH domain-containing protein 20-like [Impatiens glandulifera]|uniref:zinc finger CCCH domain-containing protein 20-like n=1 Tax=Impatiens glandulifera TaxID=253017 RepID=UPI001FB055EC|nr:zinc finger CCCH domain-containing protein 20-like [Impatiens glandulifera]
MMIGETNHLNRTLHIPPWPIYDDPFITDDFSHYLVGESLTAALQRYLPSNETSEIDFDESDLSFETYSSDHFRMFEFKVVKCTRGRSHDWTECPYAHPGEKARRRDPRIYHYSGTSCPDFRRGDCKKGDSCEYAHGVFECWLHPARYRTQPCKDGLNCCRRICFFAHTPDQIRVITSRSSASLDYCYDSPPPQVSQRLVFMSSPDSGSPSSDSPPMSPLTNRSSINEVVASLRQLQLNKMSSSWIGSPTGFGSSRMNFQHIGFNSLPTTPRLGIGLFDPLEEPVMERVESGRDLRAKMFEKLSRENPLVDEQNPDFGWVSDLVK